MCPERQEEEAVERIPVIPPGCPSCAAGWYPDGSKLAGKLLKKWKPKQNPESQDQS